MKFEEFLVESEITDLLKQLKGTADYLKAPNGKKSNLPEKQWLMVRTKSFKNWFGDWEDDKKNASKVLDENGEPLICYHVSDAEFTEFKASWRGLLFFAKTEEGARKGTVKGDSKLYKVFLNCRNIKGKRPIYFGDAESKKYQQKVIADGFDAINIRDEAKGTLAVFKSNQVKSIDNLGTFKVTSNHIHENTEHKKDIGLYSAINTIKNKCKNVDYTKPLYRGTSSKDDAYLIDYGSSDSTRKSKNQSNHYTLILDEQLKDKKLPLRSKSTITANVTSVAGIYGNVYAVFPFDSTIIGKCRDNDIWYNRVRFNGKLETYSQFNDFLNDNVVKNPESYSDIINALVDILSVDDKESLSYEQQKVYESFRKQYHDFKIMPFTKADKKDVADKVLRHMYDVDDESNFEFGTYKELDIENTSSQHEYWFSGKCVVIRLDLYKQALKDGLFK